MADAAVQASGEGTKEETTQSTPTAPVRNWSSILTQPAPVRKPTPIGPRPVATVVTGAVAAEAKKESTSDEVEKKDEDTQSTEAPRLPNGNTKRSKRPSLAEQQQPKKTILVLDSGAIIKGVRVERLGSEFWTIKEVIDEIRDSKARDFLQTFPYEIKTTEPDPQDMKAVVEFAKKTGDYASLSAVDMKVIALTRTFERENNGSDHLRAAPLPPTLVTRNKKTQADKPEGQAQWGGTPAPTAPQGGGRGRGGGRGAGHRGRGRGGGGGRGRGGAHPHPHPHPHPHSAGEEDTTTATTTTTAITTNNNDVDTEADESVVREGNATQEKSIEETETKEDEEEKKVEEAERKEEEKEVKASENSSASAAEEEKAEKEEKEASASVETTVAPADIATATEGSAERAAEEASAPQPQQQQNGEGEKEKRKKNRNKKKTASNANDTTGDATQQPRSHPSSRRNSTTPAPRAEEDDGGGWITPDNIGQMKRSAAKITSMDDLVRRTKAGVACITTDYAMQNVLIQMGLHLLSTDGMVIKRLRTYLLQCHACFKTTKEMEKVFCPNCGHHTLRKVPYSLDERTGQPILLANRVSRPVSARGTKFSLPLPKGGRHEQKLILREDELLEKTRRKKKKNKDGEDDTFDEDHAFLQPRQQNQAKFVVGKVRKNPNESQRRTGKRKKNSGALN